MQDIYKLVTVSSKELTEEELQICGVAVAAAMVVMRMCKAVPIMTVNEPDRFFGRSVTVASSFNALHR